MALFPIFDCMATGELSAMLKKMRENKEMVNGEEVSAPIDMLMVQSAVKDGS